MSAADPSSAPRAADPAEGPTAPTGATEPGFLVVGVGASAGGLEAFKEMLESIPAEPGLSFLFA